jgi:hypothetical protein
MKKGPMPLHEALLRKADGPYFSKVTCPKCSRTPPVLLIW